MMDNGELRMFVGANVMPVNFYTSLMMVVDPERLTLDPLTA